MLLQQISAGNGVSEYIHVMDLDEDHKATLDTLLAEPLQMHSLHLGCGQSHCHSVVNRDEADACLLARKFFVNAICRDVWGCQIANPNGYAC